MKIKNISINKFRGFNDVEFELGSQLTVISGQNGTQKTTILGMLSQPFSITDEKNPMRSEKPLCGGSFKSAFSDKFKFSTEFDKAGEHEWTLSFDDDTSYTVESIHRDKEAETIRFWQKGTKEKGSGYIQIPVIYLSLQRLYPIGEDNRLKENSKISLDAEEIAFYQKWHNKILILTREDDKILKSSFLTSTIKQTLGANTKHYDWKTNSAGQDNISKILLAIISFKRLKNKYPSDYKGGILAIDELDSTLYPGSQIKLIDALIKFAAKYDIQIIFTTHSLSILEKVSSILENSNRADQLKLILLTKEDSNIVIKQNIDFNYINNHLNRTLANEKTKNKIDIYTEDKEAQIFVKSLLGRVVSNLNYMNIPLGCGNLVQLSTSKVPSFIFPNSIIILDGDANKNSKLLKKIKKCKNILILPTDKSPEQIISSFLNNLPDIDPCWKNIDPHFNHQYCFQNYSNENIQKDRDVSKIWFNQHLKNWGRNATKVLNPWKEKNVIIVEEFRNNFVKLYDKIIEKTGQIF